MTLVAQDFPERAFRVTRAQYRSMAEHGAFEGRRVELIRGEIVEMPPQNHPHSWGVQRLTTLIARALPDGYDVRPQLPVIGPDESEPEPDLLVVRSDPDATDHPETALLVVEVADTSVAYDRRVKARLYAEMGIPEMWIVDVSRQRIDVLDTIDRGEYTRTRPFGPSETVSMGAFPAVRIAVAEVLTKRS